MTTSRADLTAADESPLVSNDRGADRRQEEE